MIRTILTDNQEVVCILGPEVHVDLAHVQQAVMRLRYDGLRIEEAILLIKAARDVLDALALNLELIRFVPPPEKREGDFERRSGA